MHNILYRSLPMYVALSSDICMYNQLLKMCVHAICKTSLVESKIYIQTIQYLHCENSGMLKINDGPKV